MTSQILSAMKLIWKIGAHKHPATIIVESCSFYLLPELIGLLWFHSIKFDVLQLFRVEMLFLNRSTVSIEALTIRITAFR